MKKKNIKYKHVFAEGDTLNTVVTGNKSTQANTNWGAAASGAASLIGQGINNLQTPKYTANQYQFTDTNSILASNPGTIKAQTTNTLGATASGAASGAAIGSIVPGIGTAIGGVIGGATGLLTSIFGNNKKKKAAEEANRVNTENFQTAATSSQQNNLMQSLNNNTNAFGGDIFSQGGNIHINPTNKGKFNALKARTGKSTEELTHSKNTLTRKRAIFAQNASHWDHKHDDGGTLFPDNVFAIGGHLMEDGSTQSAYQSLTGLNNSQYKDIYSQERAVNGTSNSADTTYTGNTPTVRMDPMSFNFIGNKSSRSSAVPIDIYKLFPDKNTANEWYNSNADNFKAGKQVTLPQNIKGFANGGNLFGEGGYVPFNNGVTEFNTGGTHEQNPNDGIQQGIAPDNQPNLVEEGEVKYNNYIYSNRLSPSQSLLEGVGLPSSYKNKTFGDIAKSLSKESKERPNDPISKEGLDNTMGKLKQAQDALKAEKAAKLMAKLSKLGVQLPQQTQGQVPQGQPQEQPQQQGNPMQQPQQEQSVDPNMSSEMAFGGNIFAKGNQLTISPTFAKGTYGYGDPKIEDSLTIETENPEEDYRNYNSMNLPSLNPQNNNNFRFSDYTGGTNPNSNSILASTNYKQSALPLNSKTVSTTTNTKKPWLNESDLRYAPIVGNVLGLLGNKKDYTHATEVGNAQVAGTNINNYLAFNPLDRNYYTNQLNQNNAATRSATRDASGGNRANFVANTLAADYGYNTGLGNLARQSEEYNNAEKERVGTFNRGTNQFNAQQSNWAQGINTENKVKSALLKEQIDSQYDQAKSAGVTNLFNSIGNIGVEAYQRNAINNNPAWYYNTDRTGNTTYRVQDYMKATGIKDPKVALKKLQEHYNNSGE